VETFFTADLHFGHANILRHHPSRPGDDVEAMAEAIIERWNATVGRGDEVWLLGDFSFETPEDKARTFHRLHGRKHLIVGNHDNNATKRLPWTSVGELHTWKAKPNKAVLCHYPLLTWNGAHHGVWMLHGHSHGFLAPSITTRMDVGIDCNPEFRPFHLDEIVEIMSCRTYDAVDHHGQTE
jgi:calcineurin-like phosphoesterase family protein